MNPIKNVDIGWLFFSVDYDLFRIGKHKRTLLYFDIMRPKEKGMLVLYI